MPDVLETLKYLPEHCAIWLNDQAFIVKRGVIGMTEFALATQNDVVRYNAERNVTPAQRQAMEHGCVFGWESEGARPAGSGEKKFRYTATITFVIDAEAGCEAGAAQKAEASITKLVENMNYNLDYVAGFVSASFDNSNLDLIE